MKLTTPQIVNFSVFLFFALTFATRSGYSLGAALLIIAAIIRIKSITQYIKKINLPLNTKLFILFLVLFSLFQIIPNLIQNLSMSEFDKPIRYIIIILPLLLLIQYEISLKTIAFATLIGSIIIGLQAIYDVYILDVSRAGGRFTVVIDFGNIALLMTSFVILSYEELKKYIHQLIIMSSISLGFIAVILSGSRGAWSYIPILLFIVIFFYRKKLTLINFFNNKKKISVLLLLFVGVTSFVYPKISSRINAATNDITLYQDGHSNSSVGLRFEMWKSAIDTIKTAPLFGAGDSGIAESNHKLAQQGEINLPKVWLDNDNPHNQYLYVFAKYGVFAFLSLMALFLLPLHFFYIHRNSPNNTIKTAAYLGICTVLGCMTFSLTESILINNAMQTFYLFSIIIFYSICIKRDINHET